MNIQLGAPYEKIIDNAIARGEAGTRVEVIRQALKAYDQGVSLEEVLLVNKGLKKDLAEIRSGKVKVHPLDEVLAKYRK